MPLLHHRLLVTALLITSTTTLSISCPVELTVISHPPASLRLPSPTPVFGEGGGGGGPFCTRVHLRGRPSRLRDPSRFFYALRVRANATRPNALELCFHRNATVGPCKCAASQWQKMPKSGLWAQAISPYDHRVLDFRMPADPSRFIVVSTEEEFLLHRVVFLVLGMVLMAVAHMLSESVVFYYGGAMTIGIFLVILIIFFQFVNDLHALISPPVKGTPLPLILLGKSNNALLSIFLFLDQIVWAGRTGIYKNKERAEFLSRIAFYCFLGSNTCTTIIELAELQRLSKSMKKLEKELKHQELYKNEQYRMKLQKSNERLLTLIKSSLDIVVAVGLLQLAPKKITPRVTGAFGFASSLIACYQLLPAPAKSK